MSVFVANELASILDSKISIGRINIGLLNRIIIDDLLLNDQSGKEMLKVTRLSAKFDILPLFSGKISISNIQLFGFNINLNKQTPKDKPNFQFVLDAFASKDTVQKKNNLDLRINSLLIRRGKVSYDVLSEKETPGKFNPQHLRLRNIIANISLKALQNDSINAAIKRLSIEEEHSGFELKKLSLKVIGNDQRMKIENFAIDLPNTSLAMDTIHMDYDSLGAFDNLAQDVRFSFHLLPSQIALQDLSAFVPAFGSAMDTIHMDYDSLGAFDNLAQDVRFSFHLLPSQIALQDLSAFVPAFGSFKEKLQVEVQTDGTINQLNCPHLSVSVGNHFYLRGDVSLQDLSHPENAYVFGNLSNLYADPEGIAFFVRNFSKNYNGVPPVLQHLGTVSFRGEVSGYFTDLVTYGQVRTDIGTIQTDVKLSSNNPSCNT